LKRLSEELKLDVALTPQSFTGAKTGQYFSMKDYGKALFVATIGAMAAEKTSALQVMQAKDAAADGAKEIANSTATITANTGVAEATITAGTVVANDKVTINGIEFKAVSTTPDAAKREFLAGGADNKGDTADTLAAAINHATAGVPGVTAASDGTSKVTLTADEPGEVVITITDAASTLTVATVQAIGYVECDESYLDEGYTHIGLKVTNNDTMIAGALLLRGRASYAPVAQNVAAVKADNIAEE
jgi:hypothetical protein